MSDDIRIAVCVPTSGICRSWFAHSLTGLMGYGNALRSRQDAPALYITLFMQETSVIHANREMLAKQALDWKATHIMFVDDDMVFDPTVLSILLGRRHAFVGCNYPKRGWPITFTAVKEGGKGHVITHKESTGLEEVAYTGFGVSLIEAQVFEKTSKPWFLPLYIAEGDMYTTEDNPFCERIRKAGFHVYVDHDASKLVGHSGSHTFMWDQWTPPKPAESAEVIPMKAAHV